jgi:hypothetical protein
MQSENYMAQLPTQIIYNIVLMWFCCWFWFCVLFMHLVSYIYLFLGQFLCWPVENMYVIHYSIYVPPHKINIIGMYHCLKRPLIFLFSILVDFPDKRTGLLFVPIKQVPLLCCYFTLCKTVSVTKVIYFKIYHYSEFCIIS